MRFWFCTATAIVMLVGAAPCFGQSTLTGPVEVVNEPIAMKYGEISGVHFAAEVTLDYYKSGEKVRTVEERLEGMVDAHHVGSNLEVSMVGYSGVAITDESHATSQSNFTCLMRTTGEQLECGQGKVAYPLLDRPSYKTGDTITFPFGAFNGTKWDVSGTVRGKSQIGQRPVLVVEFAGSRKDKSGTNEIDSEFTGLAYLDVAVGHPLHMEITADFRGPFRDHDRMLLVMRIDSAMPAAQQ
jgi:hypothetical protein